MDYQWHDFVGNLGVLLILSAYLAVQMRRLDATGAVNLVGNGLGAALILVSLAYDFNLSAFLIEVVWLLISLYGLARIFLERRVR